MWMLFFVCFFLIGICKRKICKNINKYIFSLNLFKEAKILHNTPKYLGRRNEIVIKATDKTGAYIRSDL